MNSSELHESLRIEVLLRIQRGVLTRTMLASRTNLHPSHISNFLNRKVRLSLDALDLVLEALHLDVEGLLGRSPAASFAVVESYESVPLVSQAVAIYDGRVSSRNIIAMVKVRQGALANLRSLCSHRRRNWQRFVAVQLTPQQADYMYPIFGPECIVVIDRHYNSPSPYSAERPTIYAVAEGNVVRVRYVQASPRYLVLRPRNRSYPVEVLSLEEGRSVGDLIVGRVCFSESSW